MSAPHLDRFLVTCRQALGDNHVIDQGARLEELSKDPVYTCTPPVAVVYPGNPAEVSAVLAAATENRVPVWVYSTGKNWGYCNTSGADGSVLMILNRLNRIIHVDRELAYAEIEPGVTYTQLNQYLRDNNIPLWTDCTGGPPTGSVLGNAIDRGFGVTPYSDHYEQICGMEIVLADGSLIRTGGYQNTDKNRTWHTFKRSAGPEIAGLFSQSNFGVVVRAGFWLMPEPETLELGTVRLKNPDDLPQALDHMRDLILKGNLPGRGRFTNDVASLTMLTQLSAEKLPDSQGPLTEAHLSQLRERHGLAKWTGAVGLYGSKGVVKAAKRQNIKKLRTFGRVTFVNEAKVESIRKIHHVITTRQGSFAARVGEYILWRVLGCSLEVAAMIPWFLKIHKGIPNESIVRRAYFYHPTPRPSENVDVTKDGIGLMWFVPLVPFRGSEIVQYIEQTAEIFARHGFDHSVSITPVNARTVVPLMIVLYHRDDPASCERAGALYTELHTHALDQGYQQFRCGHPGWDQLFIHNPELKHFLERFKCIMDPSGILAPGRYGIQAETTFN